MRPARMALMAHGAHRAVRAPWTSRTPTTIFFYTLSKNLEMYAPQTKILHGTLRPSWGSLKKWGPCVPHATRVTKARLLMSIGLIGALGPLVFRPRESSFGAPKMLPFSTKPHSFRAHSWAKRELNSPSMNKRKPGTGSWCPSDPWGY